MFFFFSSRRRHTRFDCDWSSDVCSSDLIGVYLIMVNDPDILFNDGFYPLLHVVMPEGCLLNPRYPAALGCRTHGLTRLFDVLGGALTKQAPELNTAAGHGTSPYMLYSGWKDDGEVFYALALLYG